MKSFQLALTSDICARIFYSHMALGIIRARLNVSVVMLLRADCLCTCAASPNFQSLVILCVRSFRLYRCGVAMFFNRPFEVVNVLQQWSCQFWPAHVRVCSGLHMCHGRV
eukprot:jgi/Botrbrau1/21137/Bobra.0061s0031.1